MGDTKQTEHLEGAPTMQSLSDRMSEIKEPKKSITTRVPVSLYEQVKAKLKKTGGSVSRLTEVSFRAYLEEKRK